MSLVAMSCQRQRPTFELAGEEGFDPSNGGIKIRCLTQLGDSPARNPSAPLYSDPATDRCTPRKPLPANAHHDASGCSVNPDTAHDNHRPGPPAIARCASASVSNPPNTQPPDPPIPPSPNPPTSRTHHSTSRT